MKTNDKRIVCAVSELSGCAGIKQCRFYETHDVFNDRQLYCEIEPEVSWLECARASAIGSVSQRLMRRTSLLFRTVYSDERHCDDPYTGWIDSFSGKPHSVVDMDEWMTTTVGRLKPLAVGTVVEIGSGAGLIATALIPIASHFTAIDISGDALARIRCWAVSSGLGDRLRIVEADARWIREISTGSVDLVIINSAVQYFPSSEYLLEVIEQSFRVLSTDGKLFIGDVRNLDLLDDFHAHKLFKRTAVELTVGQARHLTSSARSLDGEMCISSSFFEQLPDSFADWEVGVANRRGVRQNEMTLYRYDVLFRRRQRAAFPFEVASRAWEATLKAGEIKRMAAESGGFLKLQNIPHAALTEARGRVSRLKDRERSRLWPDQSNRTLLASDAAIVAQDLERLGCEVSWRLSQVSASLITVDIMVSVVADPMMQFYPFRSVIARLYEPGKRIRDNVDCYVESELLRKVRSLLSCVFPEILVCLEVA